MSIREFADKVLNQKQKQKINAFRLISNGYFKQIKNPYGLKLENELPNKILIGTHHKTGTVLLNSIFREICLYHSLNFYIGKQRNLPAQYDVFFQDHSRFEFDSLKRFRGLHIIRDPRDVIVSGCFYHQKSDEKWLHIPREEMNGLTYQEKINSFRDVEDQILFEMEHGSKRTIRDMMSWDYNHPNFYEVKYEDLIEDYDLKLFHDFFSFLGFPGYVMPSLLTFAYNNSLFSGRLKKSGHIRSGRLNQWKRYFNQNHRYRFLELFDDVLIRLGYEKDNDWV